MFFSWTRFFAKAKNLSRKPQRAAKRAATGRERFIPRIEPLETRVAPAIDFVTNLGGGNTAGSLKAVITAATAGDTIEFQTTGTILLSGGNVTINKNLTIDGTGANIAVSGANLTGITKGGDFRVSSGNVFINALTITGGKAALGGGIYNKGTLTIANDTIFGNSASSGGGIYNSDGNVTLANDAITGNSASDEGGGIYNNGYSTVTLTNDTIAGNSASYEGGGIYNYAYSTVSLTNDTIAGNTASYYGGGMYNFGGTVTLSSDTIAHNSATFSGGGILTDNYGSVNIHDTIVDGNTAKLGADVQNSGFTTESIFTSSGGNLYGSTSGGISWMFGGSYPDIHDTSENPGLGPLQNNGGPTQTIALLPGSPALGAGNPASPAPSTDQRGFPRNLSGPIDIGAFENQNQWFNLTAPASQNTTALTPTSFALGSFSYSGSAPGFWTVTVNWGDGSAPTSFLTTSQGTIPAQTHAYTTFGTYTVTIYVSDLDGDFGQTTATVQVAGVVVNTTADTNAVNAAVSPLDSSGNVSLRSAIEYADANNFTGSITFVPGLTGTIGLTKGNLQITDTSNLTIDGSGAAITVSGKNLTGISKGGVFYINTAASDVIDYLTIAGGNAVTGGGIYDLAASLTLANDTITGNSATFEGGGIVDLGANTLILTNDTFSSNQSPGGGAVCTATATVTLTDDTLYNNYTTPGGSGGAMAISTGNVTLINVTISDNSAPDGGIGGGIYLNASNLTLFNDTVVGNSASYSGGGIHVSSRSSITVYDTILAANTASTGPDLSGAVTTDKGYNLVGNTSGSMNWSGPGDILNPDAADLGLGALQNNGGPTQTVALLPGSLALATGSTNGVTVDTDQRGLPRTVGGKIDIGAFENQSQLFTITAPPAGQTATAGAAANFQLGSFSYTGSAGNVWTVTVLWGDGTSTVFGTSLRGSLGTQTHTYAAVGVYTITVGVSDADGDSGQAKATVAVGGTITVNTLADTDAEDPSTSPQVTGGNISLLSALEYVNKNNVPATINFVPGLSGTITLVPTTLNPEGNLPITDSQNLTIDGTGAAITVDGSQLSGILYGGVFDVYFIDATDTIRGLTITGGTATNAGGGVYNSNSNLTLSNDVIVHNSAGSSGSTYGYGGGIISYGPLTLLNDTIAYNTANSSGPTSGGYPYTASGGGVYGYNLTAANCTFDHNSTSGLGGAIATSEGNLSLTSDTISYNTAGRSGGGIYNGFGSLVLTNDTIAFNSAAAKGGGVFGIYGYLTIANDTIAFNSAGTSGGGVYQYAGTSSSIYDTIVDGNTGTDLVYASTAGSTFVSKGGNLYGTSSGISWIGSDHQDSGGNLKLGPLQNNGGPTPTLAELPGSYTLGHGVLTNGGVNLALPSTDQRGFARTVNGTIDIGAFENQDQLFTITPPGTPPSPDAGNAATFNLGSFTYSGTTTSVWRVDVNWGDGSPDTVFTTFNQGSLGSQGHTYASDSGSPYTLTVTVFDVNGNFAQASTSVTVYPAIAFTTTSLPPGIVNNAYSKSIVATGGQGTITYTETGALDGLNFTSGGLLSGTPTATGTFPFTVTAKDTNGGSATQNFTLVVNSNVITVNTLLDTHAANAASSPVDTNGNGEISLRSALEYANATHLSLTINFVSGLSGTIGIGTLGTLGVNDPNSLTIDGSGASITVNGGYTGAFGSGVLVFYVASGAKATINDLSIIDGNGNTAGGLYNDGTLTLTNDTIANNLANGGGGIDNSAGGNLTLTGCTIAYNRGDIGGINSSGGNLTLTSCTIANNTAFQDGGGISFGISGTLTINGCTIAGNNGGNSGGGVFQSAGTFKIYNTIVDGNIAGGLANFANYRGGAAVISSGGNLYGPGTALTGTYDANNNPGLGALQNNGGQTQTMAELPTSPALFVGLLTGTGGAKPPATDQRGFQRVVNNQIDSGAFENQSQWFTQTVPTTTGSTYYATRPATFNLGSFTYTGTAPSVWNVSVNWGDGTPSNPDITTFTTFSQGSLGTLSHTYGAAGNFKISVTVTDAYSNFSQASSSTFAVNAAPVATYINVVAGTTPQSATVGTQFATPLEVQVLDQNLNPVPDATVLFALPNTSSSSAGGVFANGNTSVIATTDSNGDATATTFTANTVANTAGNTYYDVYASVNGVGGPAIFQLTNNPGAVTQFGVYFSVPGQMPAGSTMNVLVEAQDKYGNLVTTDGDTVKLTSTDPKQPLNLSHALVNGQWTFNGVEQDTPGSQTITATDSSVIPNITGMRNVNVLATTASLFSGNNQTGAAGTALGNPLVVLVTDQNGNPAAGVTVSWAAATGGGSVSAAKTTTNSAGLASITATLGSIASSDTFTATIGGQTVTFNATATPLIYTIIATAGSGQSATVGTAFVTNLAVKVEDQFGNPIKGATVTFTVPSGLVPSGTFAGGINTATTTTGGVATAQVFTANILAGTYTVAATTAGVSTPASFKLTNSPPAALGSSLSAIYVENIYGLLLNRIADSSAVSWVNMLNSGTAPATVVEDIEASTEYLTDVVKALYVHYLDRPGSSSEWSGWVSQLQGGVTIEGVTAQILGSTEYFNDAGKSNTQFVKNLYSQVLQRAYTSGGLYWINALNAGSLSRTQVAMGILTSKEYDNDLVNGSLVNASWVPYYPNWGGYYPEFLLRTGYDLASAGWVQALQNLWAGNSGGLTDQEVLAAIFASPEGFGKWS